jgi:hypothetical protein
MTRPPLQAAPAPRQIRSERRDAIQAVLAVFLQYLDPASRCVGLAGPDASFISLDMTAIAEAAGLGRRRCERAIATLKKLGLVEVYPPHQHGLGSAAVKYSRARAVRACSPAFFEYLTQTDFGLQGDALANPAGHIDGGMD